jgi:hypothetical protein
MLILLHIPPSTPSHVISGMSVDSALPHDNPFPLPFRFFDIWDYCIAPTYFYVPRLHVHTLFTRINEHY